MSIKAHGSGCACLTVLLAAGFGSLQASEKKPSGEINQLKQQVQKLQSELHNRDQKIQQLQKEIQSLQQQVQKAKGATQQDDSKVHQLQQQLKDRDQKIARLTADLKKAQGGKVDLTQELNDLRATIKDLQAVRDARFVHALYFRARSIQPADQSSAALEEASRTLSKVPGVRAVWVGRPTGAEADDKEWKVGLTVLLDDEAAMRGYLKHPLNKKVGDGLVSNWEVKIYDYQCPAPALPDPTVAAKNAKKDLAQQVADLRATTAELQTLRQARGVHTLVLRLKKGAGVDQINALLNSAPQALAVLAGVRGVWVGRVTPVPGSPTEKGFQVGISVVLDDAAALRRFLDDPNQRRFLDGVKKSWELTAYDFAP